MKRLAYLLIVAAAVLAVLGVVSAAQSAPTKTAVQVRTVAATFQGKPIRWWASRAVENRREANALRWRLQQRFETVENAYEHAAKVAAAVLGVDAATLIRKGRCESSYWTKFHNRSGASGPWQFLPSTWATTPVAAFSPYDPFAAAVGAAWMHKVGRGGEWVCR